MKNLGHIYTDKAELELIQCDCSFHIALGSGYIAFCKSSAPDYPTWEFLLTCPRCDTAINVLSVLAQDVE